MTIRLAEDPFLSIQGEGTHVGEKMVFVRLQGCNTVCPFCDTAYAQDRTKGNKIDLGLVVDRVGDLLKAHGASWVEISGGEPLLQEEAVYEMAARLSHANIVVETNGTIEIRRKPQLFPYMHFCVDYKLGEAGRRAPFNRVNWSRLHSDDELKFVVSSRADFDEMVRACEGVAPRHTPILVSPAFPVGWRPMGENQEADELAQTKFMQELWRWVCEAPYPFRLQVQLHKICFGSRALV
jgi:7-carboxy-7-deazaguanine synthase